MFFLKKIMGKMLRLMAGMLCVMLGEVRIHVRESNIFEVARACFCTPGEAKIPKHVC